MTNNQIDLIALDLDGTLLDSHERITRASRRQIRRVLDAGIRVVFVTGRGVDTPIRISHELGLNLPVICCHGALIKDFVANKTIDEIPVPLQYAKPMVEFAQREGLPIAIYTHERFWRLADAPLYMPDMTGPAWSTTPSFDDLLGTAPTFIRFLGKESVAAARREFGDWPVALRHETWMEFDELVVLNRDAGKQPALARLCDDLGIAAQRVLAIGDSRNDVPMLQWAGIGVAMGNALPEVKAAVPYTTATNDRDGVALAIQRFVPAVTKKPA